MKLTIILLFVITSLNISAQQDTIFFLTLPNSVAFEDSINLKNQYPRQDAIKYQTSFLDTISGLYYQNINKVSEKALTASDSNWVPMMSLEIGDTITYEDIKYIVIQKHFSTIGWQPTTTLGVLFVRMRTDDNWHAGIIYYVNDTVLYLVDDNSYYCIQAHTSQETWNPVATIGVLWGLISVGCDEWYQTIYSIGDCVTFNGVEYTSLIDGNNFSPSAYPQGWFTSECLPYVASTYNLDECIIFNGSNYISLIDNNSWTPITYPAGWAIQ